MTADSLPSGFRNNIRADGSPYITPDTTVNIDSLVSCTSTSLSSQTWSLTGDITQLIGMGTEFIFGFWVNFQSTISTKVFQFEDDAGSYYIVSSTKDGALKVSFQSGSSPADPANDVPITVPLNKWIFIVFHFKQASTFIFGFWVKFQSTISTKVFQFGDSTGPHYIVSSTKDGALKVSFQSGSSPADPANDIPITVPLNKYIFIVFHFKQVSTTVTLDIILPKTAMITKSSADFALPGGKFYFGISIKAKFKEVILTKTAIIDGSYDTITLDDGSAQNPVTAPCDNPGACSDDVCNSPYACNTLYDYCTACDSSNGCTSCDSNSSRGGSWCTSCLDSTFEVKNYHCCAIDHHCDECSTKSTQCDVCAAEHYLYQESPTSTTCLSCANSCTQCSPGPTCYNCAETITQTGGTCRVDSVGFQISADLPNIVLDFAYPLSTGLTKSSFTATSNSNAPIPTVGWTITGCTVGLKQCSITTDNLHESDLPISLDFQFTQA
eukprot:CAMPEP_0202954160 /NCGR_PEP_ID=MMETSP1395-20130829/50598_1 /ASSEMBLY_ACC=CAM_ASM_000871 /TAXON_ID=5961 /ORGANISM="Blepharisma japonicum, Strain Stock R1072" /LENGTH=495 /DNA_ID=CAMNT_0049669535 /DNA_START=539 /DNA_END=2026 /DNA_ORIENTATION=-